MNTYEWLVTPDCDCHEESAGIVFDEWAAFDAAEVEAAWHRQLVDWSRSTVNPFRRTTRRK
jgi:hypothetical protein